LKVSSLYTILQRHNNIIDDTGKWLKPPLSLLDHLSQPARYFQHTTHFSTPLFKPLQTS
jgi:hypothetical protein